MDDGQCWSGFNPSVAPCSANPADDSHRRLCPCVSTRDAGVAGVAYHTIQNLTGPCTTKKRQKKEQNGKLINPTKAPTKAPTKSTERRLAVGSNSSSNGTDYYYGSYGHDDDDDDVAYGSYGKPKVIDNATDCKKECTSCVEDFVSEGCDTTSYRAKECWYCEYCMTAMTNYFSYPQSTCTMKNTPPPTQSPTNTPPTPLTIAGSGSGSGSGPTKAPTNAPTDAPLSTTVSPTMYPTGADSGSSTGSVWCGGHEAASCADCPQGNGASWCNGECTWLNGACVDATGDDEDGDEEVFDCGSDPIYGNPSRDDRALSYCKRYGKSFCLVYSRYRLQYLHAHTFTLRALQSVHSRGWLQRLLLPAVGEWARGMWFLSWRGKVPLNMKRLLR
jgi:hypothetical protein